LRWLLVGVFVGRLALPSSASLQFLHYACSYLAGLVGITALWIKEVVRKCGFAFGDILRIFVRNEGYETATNIH
jgi:hypothetical protein